MGSFNTPNGNIESADDPIAARNLAAEEARQEITREIAAKVFAKHNFDPYASAAFMTEPVATRELRVKVEAEIAKECAIEWAKVGLQ